MLAAGMFEYNFGDSEFLMLFLVLLTLSAAAAYSPKESVSIPRGSARHQSSFRQDPALEA